MRLNSTGVPTMYTPWGQPDNIEQIAEGIQSVSTPSHGGWILSDARQDQLPMLAADKNFNRGQGRGTKFWEEDCDWCVPFLFFQKEVREHYQNCCGPYLYEQHLEGAERTAQAWHPAFYAYYLANIKEKENA